LRKEKWPRRDGHGAQYAIIILLFLKYILLRDVILSGLASCPPNTDVGSEKCATAVLLCLEENNGFP